MKINGLDKLAKGQNTVKNFIPLNISMILLHYFLCVENAATDLGDIYIFQRIEVDTVLLLIALLIIILALNFASKSKPLLFYMLLIAIIPILPILKYPNPLNVAGIGDAVAHYSFTKYIVLNQQIPMQGEVYYSYTYGRHPGNGLVNAFLYLISSLDLGIGMVSVLSVGYISYALLVYSLVVKCLFNKARIKQPKSYVDILSIISLLLIARYPPTYTGLHVSWIHSGMITYLLFKVVGLFPETSFNKTPSKINTLLALSICYIGLMLTHLSSFVINVLYTVFTLFLANLMLRRGIFRKTVLIMIVTLIFYVIYQVYLDIEVLRVAIAASKYFFMTFGLSESSVMTRSLMNYNVGLLDLIRFFIGIYTDAFTILMFFIIQLILWLLSEHMSKYDINKSTLNRVRFITICEFFLAIPIIINIVILRELITSIWRVVPTLQVNIICNLALISSLYSTKRINPEKNRSKIGSFLRLSIRLVVLGLVVFMLFATNFAHGYINPQITYKDEKYTIKTDYCLSPIILNSLVYLNTYYDAESAHRFISITPYVSFSLADLLWNVKKVPSYGTILTTSPEDVLQVIDNHPKGIYLIPRSDTLIGKIGQRSYFILPFEFLLKDSSIIYSSEYIAMFIKN